MRGGAVRRRCLPPLLICKNLLVTRRLTMARAGRLRCAIDCGEQRIWVDIGGDDDAEAGGQNGRSTDSPGMLSPVRAALFPLFVRPCADLADSLEQGGAVCADIEHLFSEQGSVLLPLDDILDGVRAAGSRPATTRRRACSGMAHTVSSSSSAECVER